MKQRTGSNKPSVPPLEFKGSRLTLMVLHLNETASETLEAELEKKVQQAPGMFKNTPVLIDLQVLKNSAELPDLPFLVRLMRKHGMIPVGVRGGTERHHTLAVNAGLNILPDARLEKAKPEPQAAKPAVEPSVPTKTVLQPIRSGQQIVAAKGDLVVLSTVSPGAEILAERNIHVYGALRGRALAGVNGDESACIFCRYFDAELIAIAGRYQVNEEYADDIIGKPARIYLQNDALMIETFGA